MGENFISMSFPGFYFPSCSTVAPFANAAPGKKRAPAALLIIRMVAH